MVAHGPTRQASEGNGTHQQSFAPPEKVLASYNFSFGSSFKPTLLEETDAERLLSLQIKLPVLVCLARVQSSKGSPRGVFIVRF